MLAILFPIEIFDRFKKIPGKNAFPPPWGNGFDSVVCILNSLLKSPCIRLILHLLNWFCKRIQPQLDDHGYLICSLQCAILDRSTKDSWQRKRRDEASEFIAVPGDLMGFVIGKKGSSIKEIELESGAKLSSHDDQGGFLVSGNKEQRARARELIEQKVVSAD